MHDQMRAALHSRVNTNASQNERQGVTDQLCLLSSNLRSLKQAVVFNVARSFIPKNGKYATEIFPRGFF